MKRLVVFLQVVVVLVGIAMLAVLIRFPLTEGRAANLDLFHVYSDPFIIYVYLASIAFFVALFQAFKLLGYVGQNKVFSPNSVKALKVIKYCAIILTILIVSAAVYIRISYSFAGPDVQTEDPAGFIALSTLAIFISMVVASFAAVFEKVLQNAIEMLKK